MAPICLLAKLRGNTRTLLGPPSSSQVSQRGILVSYGGPAGTDVEEINEGPSRQSLTLLCGRWQCSHQELSQVCSVVGCLRSTAQTPPWTWKALHGPKGGLKSKTGILLSFLRRKEILTQVTTWMKLEDIMLSDKPLIKGQILPDSTYI